MAKLILQFKPRKGFGPITLGSSRDEVRAAMANLGFPLEGTLSSLDFPIELPQTEIDRFCDGSIQAEFRDGRLSFIGVFYSEEFLAHYRDVDVFDVTAHFLFQTAADADNSGHHDFDPLEYCFPNQILTLWDASRQYDYRCKGERQVWGQVGLGSDAYLAAAKALENDG